MCRIVSPYLPTSKSIDIGGFIHVSLSFIFWSSISAVSWYSFIPPMDFFLQMLRTRMHFHVFCTGYILNHSEMTIWCVTSFSTLFVISRRRMDDNDGLSALKHALPWASFSLLKVSKLGPRDMTPGVLATLPHKTIVWEKKNCTVQNK